MKSVNRSCRRRTDDRFRAADVSIGIIVRRSQPKWSDGCRPGGTALPWKG